MSKWNIQFANGFGSKAQQKETLNRGASFLVAPHNLTYDKRAIKASEANTSSVIQNLESILQNHKDAEEKKL